MATESGVVTLPYRGSPKGAADCSLSLKLLNVHVHARPTRPLRQLSSTSLIENTGLSNSDILNSEILLLLPVEARMKVVVQHVESKVLPSGQLHIFHKCTIAISVS